MANPGTIVDSGANGTDASLAMLLSPGGGVEAIPEEDRQKARWVWGLYQKAKKWKLSCGADNWNRWWDLWLGIQWARQRAMGLSQPVINMIYEVVETFLGHVTDDIPDMVAHARNPEHRDISEMVTKLMRWTDDLNRTPSRLELSLRSALVTGFSARRVDWDEKLDRSRGAVKYQFVDENFLFVAPWTTELQEAEYVIEAKNVPLSVVKRLWDKGSLVPGGVWDGALTPFRGESQSSLNAGYSAFTTTDGSATQFVKPENSRDKSKDLCTLLQCWIRQDDGKLRYLVVANGIVLDDGPSPYDDERYPYVIYNLIQSKSSVYGHSMIAFIEKLQSELNEMHAYALDQQRYDSDSPLVVNVANAQEGQRLDNLPGKVLTDRSPDGRGYYLLQRPGANPQWFNMQEQVIQRIRDIAGNVDILRGDRPAGVSTLGGMEIIRDEANILVSKMAKNITTARMDEAVLTVDRLRQFFKDERVIRITGSNFKDEYLTINQRGQQDLTGEFSIENAIPDDFEADISFMPEPPGGPQAKMERDLQLLQLQVIGPQWMLRDLEFPQSDIDEITQEIQQMQQQQAQMQAQAMAQQQPNQGGQQDMSQSDPQELERQGMSVISGL